MTLVAVLGLFLAARQFAALGRGAAEVANGAAPREGGWAGGGGIELDGGAGQLGALVVGQAKLWEHVGHGAKGRGDEDEAGFDLHVGCEPLSACGFRVWARVFCPTRDRGLTDWCLPAFGSS